MVWRLSWMHKLTISHVWVNVKEFGCKTVPPFSPEFLLCIEDCIVNPIIFLSSKTVKQIIKHKILISKTHGTTLPCTRLYMKTRNFILLNLTLTCNLLCITLYHINKKKSFFSLNLSIYYTSIMRNLTEHVLSMYLYWTSRPTFMNVILVFSILTANSSNA